MSSSVHQRRGGPSHAAPSSNRHGGASSNKSTKSGKTVIADSKELSSALTRAREMALSNGLTVEQFRKCAERVAKQVKLRSPPSKPSRCGCVVSALKVIWLIFLMLLALALMSAAVKPVMFYMHKDFAESLQQARNFLLHTHMYSITRPVRLGLVSFLPYFQSIGFDFLHQDCLIENPLISPEERCPCTHIKHPTFFTINSTHTQLPRDALQLPLSEIIVVEGGVSMPSNLSLDQLLTSDPVSGGVPMVCMELTVEGQSGIRFYHDLFNKKKMKKLLKKKLPWTFSWEECPDARNSRTLRTLFPSPTGFLPSDLHTSKNALFTVTTQWAPSSYYHDIFSDGRLILMTVVLGELRLLPEPPQESQCMEVCSGFKSHPVLKQGDSVVFDQQFWSYQATTWSDVALTYSVAVS